MWSNKLVDVRPHHFHGKGFKKQCLCDQYEPQKLLHQVKLFSVLMQVLDLCFKTDLRNCEPTFKVLKMSFSALKSLCSDGT